MKSRRLSVIFALLFICSSQPISASITWENFATLRKTAPDVAHFYLVGLLDGIETSNVSLIRRNQAPLYCNPMKLVLNVDNLMQMLEDFLKIHPVKA